MAIINNINQSRFSWEVRASDPVSPQTAQVWYNSTDDVYRGAQAGGVWTAENSLNTARRSIFDSSSGTTSGALSFGGRNSGGTALTTTESWNGTSWSGVSGLNTARFDGGSAGATNTACLAFGGQSNSAVTESWNGTSWSSVNSLNTGRSNSTGCGTSSDALSIGGDVSGISSAITEQWDGTNWSAVNSLNTARNSLSSAGIVSDALSFGGASGATLATTERWNGTSWSSASSLNTTVQQNAGAGSTGAGGISFGGFNGSSITSVTEEYNGTANVWNTRGSMNTARAQLGGTGTSAGALSFGGYNPSGSDVLGTTESYTNPTIVDFTVT